MVPANGEISGRSHADDVAPQLELPFLHHRAQVVHASDGDAVRCLCGGEFQCNHEEKKHTAGAREREEEGRTVKRELESFVALSNSAERGHADGLEVPVCGGVHRQLGAVGRVARLELPGHLPFYVPGAGARRLTCYILAFALVSDHQFFWGDFDGTFLPGTCAAQTER